MSLIHMEVKIILETGRVVKAGDLVYRQVGQTTQSSFRYDTEYLKDPEAVALCTAELPLHSPGKRKIYQTPKNRPSGLHRVFESCLPGRFALGLLRKSFNLPASASPGEILQFQGFSGTGALGFISKQTTPEMADPNLEIVDAEFAEISETAQTMYHDPAQYSRNNAYVRKLTNTSGSLDGHRPKFLGSFDDRRWVIKLPTVKDQTNFAALEAASLRTAEECGLFVPDHFVASIDNQADPALFVQRYDITADNGRRIQQNADALLRDYALKHDLSLQHSYERLAHVTREMSTAPNLDLKRLFGLMVFNIGLGNKDDHSKNFEFLTVNRETRLSPVFDVLPNVYHVEQHSLALTDADPQHRSQFTRQEILEMHDYFNLSLEEATKILDTTCEKLVNWKSHALRFQASELEAEQFQLQINKNIQQLCPKVKALLEAKKTTSNIR